MSFRSEEIRENVELGENWRPKRQAGNTHRRNHAITVPSENRRSGSRLREIFESLALLWLYLGLTAIVVAMIAILYFLCEVLPKR